MCLERMHGDAKAQNGHFKMLPFEKAVIQNAAKILSEYEPAPTNTN